MNPCSLAEIALPGTNGDRRAPVTFLAPHLSWFGVASLALPRDRDSAHSATGPSGALTRDDSGEGGTPRYVRLLSRTRRTTGPAVCEPK